MSASGNFQQGSSSKVYSIPEKSSSSGSPNNKSSNQPTSQSPSQQRYPDASYTLSQCPVGSYAKGPFSSRRQ